MYIYTYIFIRVPILYLSVCVMMYRYIYVCICFCSGHSRLMFWVLATSPLYEHATSESNMSLPCGHSFCCIGVRSLTSFFYIRTNSTVRVKNEVRGKSDWQRPWFDFLLHDLLLFVNRIQNMELLRLDFIGCQAPKDNQKNLDHWNLPHHATGKKPAALVG